MHVQAHANLWRVSDDFWDSWQLLFEQFEHLNAWTPFRGTGHWPDADMLPLGNVRAWEHGWTRLTPDEQTTLMTLWSIARSPLIVGANLPNNDAFTLAILTNDEVIAVDQASTDNRQVSATGDTVVWTADVPGSADKHLAIFNVAPRPVVGPKDVGGSRSMPATPPQTIRVSLSDIGLGGPCHVRDLWAAKDLGRMTDAVWATVRSHGAAVYRVGPDR